MKPSSTTLASLNDLNEVRTQGDLRRIVANSLLALARKEVSANDIQALAKGMEAISNSLAVEVKIAKLRIELRAQGAELGEIAKLGNTLIGASPAA